MSNSPHESLRLFCKELDDLAYALDFMAEAHPHTGGRYVLIHLSNRASALADEVREEFAIREDFAIEETEE